MALKYKQLCFLFGFWAVVLFGMSGCQGARAILGESTANGVYHTVQEGQTLQTIASAYGSDIEFLARVNRLENPDKLRVGQRLWIPGADRVLDAGAYKKSPQARKQVAKKSGKLPPASQAIKGKKVTARKGGGPFHWPVNGVVTSGYGMRNGRRHEGIDIGAKTGTPIYAAADGKVMFSGWGPTGYGRMVIIKHNNEMTTLYAHTSKNHVRKNARVRKGQLIARVGATGRATGPHLHFEVRNGTHPRNPIQYLPR